jgi:diguanylate cyclase (GGDEF)-like protein
MKSKNAVSVESRTRLRFVLICYLSVFALTIVIAQQLALADVLDTLAVGFPLWEEWELDDAVNLSIVGLPGFIAIFLLHSREVHQEMDQRLKAEEKAANLASFDPLTGLANRRLFSIEFASLVRRAESSGSSLHILMLDLDHFKHVNDHFGHRAGDLVLQAVSRRIQLHLRPGDLFARLGGDEFAVVSEQPNSDKDDGHLHQLLLKAVGGTPIPLDKGEVSVTMSIGSARYPEDGDHTEALLQNADIAMYRAKQGGRNGFALFDADLDATFHDRLQLSAELRNGLTSGQVVPYFQPLLDLATGDVVGFEVLARWIHPERGVLAAGTFVPLAEDAGLIGILFRIVLENACSEAATWTVPMSLAVNLSPSQLCDPDLVETVLDTLLATGLHPSRLELEITENALVKDFERARRVIEQLKSTGVRIALDDFGTGYSSLRHLHLLSIDKIKIDRSFIEARSSSKDSEVIIKSMINLGHNLGMQVLGEGIELSDDAVWLDQQGCDQGQGYLFARPMPSDQVSLYLQNRLESLSPAGSSNSAYTMMGKPTGFAEI